MDLNYLPLIAEKQESNNEEDKLPAAEIENNGSITSKSLKERSLRK